AIRIAETAPAVHRIVGVAGLQHEGDVAILLGPDVHVPGVFVRQGDQHQLRDHEGNFIRVHATVWRRVSLLAHIPFLCRSSWGVETVSLLRPMPLIRSTDATPCPW